MSSASRKFFWLLSTHSALSFPSFYCNPRKSHHLRVSFSIVTMEKAELGFKALGEAIREKRKAQGIDV